MNSDGNHSTGSFADNAGMKIFYHKWKASSPRGIVQIIHGMMEHGARYDRFARFLNDHGFIVVACEHRGHGLTAGKTDNLGYLASKNGWDLVVDNNIQLTALIRKEYPGLPVFLFGHSFGSIVARDYFLKNGDELKGLILSGTMQQPKSTLRFGNLLVRIMTAFRGERFKSRLLIKLGYGSYVRYFKPQRTLFDWLSRDEDEVDKYVNDPFCGQPLTLSFYKDLFKGNLNVQNTSRLKRAPKNLPIFIFGGSKDPVGRNGRDIFLVADQYKKLGIKDVTAKTYPDGRHEMLNEINREEVFNDVLNWIESKL